MILFGGIEAGGTKIICAVGDSSGKIHDQVRIPTTTPNETLAQVIEFLKRADAKSPLFAIGVGSFGPIDPALSSPTYGYITATPKPGWRNFNMVGAIKKAFDLPIGFDTDVNTAAIGEYRWGAAKGLDTFIYVTVGTGIGGGGMISGKLMHGLTHPEMGHIFVPHDKKQDPFNGVCPYHGDCLEGLATGPAMMARWNVKSALDLPPDHKAWELEAEYLSYAVANWIMTLSPQRIIMGGGVMKRTELFPMIHKRVPELLNGYIQHDAILKNIQNYIVPPGLGEQSGIGGSIALAEYAFVNR
jgi:fructokinase